MIPEAQLPRMQAFEFRQEFRPLRAGTQLRYIRSTIHADRFQVTHRWSANPGGSALSTGHHAPFCMDERCLKQTLSLSTGRAGNITAQLVAEKYIEPSPDHKGTWRNTSKG